MSKSCKKCNGTGNFAFTKNDNSIEVKICRHKVKKYSITEDLSTTPCKYTADGYCLRNEDDYCPDGQCICPHLIAEIVIIATCVTCETTVEMCSNCKKQLTEPKIDC